MSSKIITMKTLTKMKIKTGDFEPEIESLEFKIQNSKSEIKRICGQHLKFSRIFCFGLIISASLNFACVNQSLLKDNKNVAIVEENNVSEYDRDLETMKTANFDYIFAFRRKDGNAFDTDDKKYLRANTPPGTNRFVSTKEGRAFIAGSRYAFSPENIAALRNRFLVEDYSKPEARAAQNTNQKTGANR